MKPDAHSTARHSQAIPTAASRGLEERVRALGLELQQSIRELLSSQLGPSFLPKDLTHRFGVNKHFASKLMMGLSAPDPLAATHYMPGHEGLRSLVARAEARSFDAALVRRVRRAVDSFESLIEDDLGGTAVLQSLVSGRVREVRRKIEAQGRQQAFRGLSLIHGNIVDTLVSMHMLLPPLPGEPRLPIARLTCWIGVRRLRFGVPLAYYNFDSGSSVQSLHGEALSDKPQDILLPEFCSVPQPQIEISQNSQFTEYRIVSDHFGREDAATVCFGERYPALVRANRAPGTSRPGFFTTMLMPARLMIQEVLLHKHCWQGESCELVVRDSAYGDTRPIDECELPTDRLESSDEVIGPTTNDRNQTVPGVPWRGELLRHACDSIGVKISDFRSYLLCSPYPMYGVRYHMYFDIAER